MLKLLPFAGYGLLTACLVLMAPSVGHAQYSPYGVGGYSPGYGYMPGYGVYAPSYTPGYGVYSPNCTPGYGIYTPGYTPGYGGSPAPGMGATPPDTIPATVTGTAITGAIIADGRIDRQPCSSPALEHPDAHVRKMAALVLGDLGATASQAVPALLQTLRDPDAAVRRRAALALGDLNALAAIPVLQHVAAQDEAESVRQAAQMALQLMLDTTAHAQAA